MRCLILFLYLLICCFSLEGKVFFKETDDFAHIMAYAKKGTLFVFDLDNTLIETTQHLGSDQWVSYRINSLMKEGLNAEEARTQTIDQLIKIHDFCHMQLVDDAICHLLAKMQEKRLPVIGLTKRNPQMADRTLEQIAPLGLDFRKTTHFEKELMFEDLGKTIYKQGIIFVGDGIEKGPPLLAYLKKLKRLPKKIVVVDDKMSHLENIAEALEPLGIELIGIRYAGADEKVKTFNPQIADLQWNCFQKILSDKQALHLLQLEPR